MRPPPSASSTSGPSRRCERVLLEERGGGLEATGVEYVDSDGSLHTIEAGAVVVAAGALNTPQLLIRSGLPVASGNSPSSDQIGRNLGLHPAAFVFGLFDEVQDAHRVYPITSHCMDFMRDEDGGFVLEASTVQDPIGFATSIRRAWADVGRARWWRPRASTGNGTGSILANDENNGRVVVGEDGTRELRGAFRAIELERMETALDFGRRVMEAAGAKRVAVDRARQHARAGDLPDGLRSGALGGGRAIASRTTRSGCSSGTHRSSRARCRSTPRMTIMALADRLAQHLDDDPNDYLSAQAAEVTA